LSIRFFANCLIILQRPPAADDILCEFSHSVGYLSSCI
jgi:hypothetical protein